MKEVLKEIFRYFKELSLPVKAVYIFLTVTFVFEMLWALAGVRIYHTYVPVRSLFDLYILAFPFIFVLINFFAVFRKKITKFFLMIDFVLQVTYPAFVSLVLMMINEKMFQ